MNRNPAPSLRISPGLLWACLSAVSFFSPGVSPAAEPAPAPVLRHSEIVFMYASDEPAYKAYGATFVAWGGADTAEKVARHHALGIRCTGSMWCLTAGARLIHDDPKMRAACAVDIEGRPVEVPWLFDHVYKDTKTYFGCTNNPDYVELLRQRVRDEMKGGADGLHIDDHLGTAGAFMQGGGFCDHCMAAFREYLKARATPEQLQAAGIGSADLAAFDYRDLVRKHARTREECRNWKVQKQIPLWDLFRQFQIEAAAENVRRLGKLAEEVAGHPVLLSANAGLASEPHRYVVKYLTHVICEVSQEASAGTGKPESALAAYAFASQSGKPLAATASGQDWAFVKANACEDLVRSWIALACAHGQRFMVPHPKKQWCFSRELGTQWYEAPIEAYAPVYRFISRHADCFDGLDAVEVKGLQPPANVLLAVRRRSPAGRVVVHVLNRDYDAAAKTFRPRPNLTIRLPASLAGKAVSARLLAYDAEPQQAPVKVEGETATLILPSLRLWTLVVLE